MINFIDFVIVLFWDCWWTDKPSPLVSWELAWWLDFVDLQELFQTVTAAIDDAIIEQGLLPPQLRHAVVVEVHQLLILRSQHSTLVQSILPHLLIVSVDFKDNIS